jgi:hypothetical protein
MKIRWEVLVWLVIGVGAVVTSLVLLQVSIRAAFDSTSQIDLEGAAIKPQTLDYGADDGQTALPILDEGVVAQAQAEDDLLRRAEAGRAGLSLPTPASFTNALKGLLAGPTAVPTMLIRAPPTSTPLPTQTAVVTATSTPVPSTATGTATWTATVTSLPTLTVVVQGTVRP